MSLVRSLGAIFIVAVAYALLMFGMVDLSPEYEACISVVVTLIGFAVVVWGSMPDHIRKP
jgi:hypothetical protein